MIKRVEYTRRGDYRWYYLGEAFESEYLKGEICQFTLNDDNAVSVFVLTDTGRKLAMWIPPHAVEAVYYG